jgi:hypothetical protein
MCISSAKVLSDLLSTSAYVLLSSSRACLSTSSEAAEIPNLGLKLRKPLALFTPCNIILVKTGCSRPCGSDLGLPTCSLHV